MDTSQLGRPDEPVSQRPRFCSDCGQPASAGRFCAQCGTALAGPLAPPATPPLVPSQPMVGPVDERPTVILSRPEPALAEPVAAAYEPAVHGDVFGDEPPFDLTWQDDDVAPAPAQSSRKRPLLIGGAVVAIAAVVAASVLVAGYVGDSGMRNALASSTRDFNAVMTSLSTAADADAAAAAADSADPAADRIDSALRRLGSGSDPAHRSVVAQLEAEQGVLTAVAGLAAISSDPLATWGAAHVDVTDSLKTETASRDALARHHSGAAAELADTTLMLSKVTAAVGSALVEDATDNAARLLKGLQEAKSTADLRKLGDAAAPEQAPVSAAATALPSGAGKQVLTGYAGALGALADLSKINAESAGGWTGTRAKLAQTFGQVAAAAGSTGGANVRVVLGSALDGADKVIGAAAAAIADWKAKTDAAIKDRQTATESLEEYASFFRSQAKTYEQLRQDLSGFIARVEDPNADVSYGEAYEFLSQAAIDRRNVRDTMVAMDVPAGVRGAHQDMVSAIDRAISAVQSADDGLEQSQDCSYTDECPYYRDTPGWARFQSESDAISKQYTRAMTDWEAAAAAEKAAINNRALPAKPQV